MILINFCERFFFLTLSKSLTLVKFSFPIIKSTPSILIELESFRKINTYLSTNFSFVDVTEILKIIT